MHILVMSISKRFETGGARMADAGAGPAVTVSPIRLSAIFELRLVSHYEIWESDDFVL